MAGRLCTPNVSGLLRASVLSPFAARRAHGCQRCSKHVALSRAASCLPALSGNSIKSAGVAGNSSASWSRQRRRRAAVVPQAAAGSSAPSEPKKGPPAILWRVAAAMTYVIPWIDSLALGREIYHSFPISLALYFIPGPMVDVYYCSQFAPLIIFFLLFLAVVKNTKVPHFVRFNCMQSIMIDIVAMLFTILRSYFPAELRWTSVLSVFDNFSWHFVMFPVLYCILFSLKGMYAEIPFVSESVYMQVEQSETA